MAIKKRQINEAAGVLLIFFLLFSFFGISAKFNYSQIVTYIVLPIVCFHALLLNNFKVHALNHPLFLLYAVFLFWAVFTSFFAVNQETAIQSLITMTMIGMCLFVSSQYLAYKRKDFLKVFSWSMVLAFLVAVPILLGDVEAERIYGTDRSFEINANQFAYAAVFALMCAIILDRFYYSKYTGPVLWAVFVVGFYVALVAMSRQILITTVPLFVGYYLSYARNWRSRAAFLFGLMVVGLIMYSHSYVLFEATLFQRYERESIRTDLALDGFVVFADNPLLGVGPAQYLEHSNIRAAFTHNTYSEAAANFGLFGLVALGCMYLFPLSGLRRWRRVIAGRRGKHVGLFVFSYGVFLFYQIFYVFYLYPPAMFMLMIFACLSMRIGLSSTRFQFGKDQTIYSSITARDQ